MNELNANPRRRWFGFSWRESLLALVAIVCACGWVREHLENRPSEAVEAVIGGMRELKRNPAAHVRVVVNFKGNFPIVCQLSRFEPAKSQ